MSRTVRTLLLVLAATCAAAVARAQSPKPGEYYEESQVLGFKVKMPKGWTYTPPQPDDENMLGKYTPTPGYTLLSPNERLWLEAYVLKFDRRPREGEEEAVTVDEDGNVEVDFRKLKNRVPDLPTWLEKQRLPYLTGAHVTEQDDKTYDKTDATEYLYTGTLEAGSEYHLFATVYHLGPDLDVAILFDGPGDKKWRKYESAFKQMAKSFRRVEVEEVEVSEAKEGDSAYRTEKRQDLERQVANLPGWELYETPNYFILSNVDDRQFVRELQDRLEAIRAVYEELYPFEQAEKLRLAASKRPKEASADDEEGEDGPPEPSFKTTTSVSSREQSRCSVVRVCATQDEYHEYGGPSGSAGYWIWTKEELVLYDDKQGGGRGDTWAVLNHEAFHQYIFYLYGNISPHSWYNEGTGDFFSGYEYKHKRFNLKPFDWRQRLIQGALRAGTYFPLKKFTRMTQGEYYAGATVGRNYAQGWSFIYFLRTGKESCRQWNDDWDEILPTYFQTLAETEDLDKAVDAAFLGVDWNELEEAWKAYTIKG